MNRWALVLSAALLAIVNSGCSGITAKVNSGSPGVVLPSITAQPANQTVTAGQTATFSVTAAGTAPLTYQWNKNGGAISGATSSSYTSPATASSDNGAQFSVVVSNSAGSVTSGAATLTVNAASTGLQVSTAQLPDGFVAGGYNSTLAATGGSTPYSWSVLSGSLPYGLTLSSGGIISGTPSLAGSFTFSAQVKDASALTASKSLSINVASPTPAVAITSPASGATVSGTSNWSYSLDSNSLSNGSHSLSAKVNDSAGQSATSSLVDFTVNNASTSTDCTLYASPSGSSGNSGTSPSAPKSFSAAASATQPGSVLCLLGGTYNLSSSFTPPNSGTPSSWIVYKNYDSTPVYFVYTGSANANSIFRITNGGSFPSGGPAYLEFRGLNLNGQGNSGDAFWCGGTHHLRFISNTMHDTGGSGIATRDCDYLTADHNLVYHNGYMPSSTSVPQWYGWTSGISFNSDQWFDNYSGFHNIISNNIVVGEFDSSPNHTDGNGIILDLSSGSYDPSTANTPPALIVNNVVYGNGGRCILGYIVTN